MNDKQYLWFWICYAEDRQGQDISNKTVKFGTIKASSEDNLVALAEIKNKLYASEDIKQFSKDHHSEVNTLAIAIRRVRDMYDQPMSIGDFSVRIPPKGEDALCECNITLNKDHEQGKSSTVRIERIFHNDYRFE